MGVPQSIAGCSVTVGGRAAGDLVLLVRLAARGSGVWDGLYDRLADDWRVAVVDLPQPQQAHLADPPSVFRDYADRCVAIAQALGVPRHHLIGWNGGAHIGLAAAIHHAQSLMSVTLITPFHRPRDPRPLKVGLDVLETLLSADRRELYVRYWFMAGLSDSFVQRHYDRVEALVQRRLADDGFVALDTARAMAWMRALRDSSQPEAVLEAIAIPMLILGAGRNRWLAGPTLEMAEDLAALLPNARLVKFPELGGLMPIEAPDAVLGAVRPFLLSVSTDRHTDSDY